MNFGKFHFKEVVAILLVVATSEGVFSPNAWALDPPLTFTYQGRFLDSTGTLPLTDTVDLTVGIYSSNGACLLYEESTIVTGVPIPLANTSGVFAIQVGSAAAPGKRTGNDPSLTMTQVFNNTGTLLRTDDSGTTNTCPGGYTPLTNHVRKLRVTVKPQTGPNAGISVTLSPDQVINSVPFAQMAQSLQGFTWASPDNIGTTTPNIGIFSSLTTNANLTLQSNGHSITLQAPPALGSSAIYTLPPSGTVGQLLQTAADGTLSWISLTNVAGTISTPGAVSGNAITTGTITTPGTVSGSAITSGTIGGATIVNTTGNIFTTGNMDVGTTAATSNRLLIAEGTPQTTFLGAAPGILNIRGGANTALIHESTADFTAITFDDTKAKIASEVTASGTYLYFGTTNLYASGITNKAMIIDPNGNVGIGPTSPAQKLDISGNMQMTGLVPYIGIKPSGWGGSAFYLQPGLTINGSVGGNYTWFIDPSSKGFVFGQNAAALMTIDTTGNVGIGSGTTTPVAQLHQDAGTAVATYHKFTAGTTTGQTSTNGFDVGITATGGAELRQYGNQSMVFYTNNTAALTLSNFGAIMTGGGQFRGTSSSSIATPSYAFVSDTNTGVFNPSTGIFGITTSGTERLRIDGSGNVGIGTTNSPWPLAVNGIIKAFHNNGFQGYQTQIGTISPAGIPAIGFYADLRGNAATNQAANSLAARSAVIGVDSASSAGNIFFSSNKETNATLGGLWSPTLASNINMYITGPTGYVGIGTTSPSKTLDVNGSIYIEGQGTKAANGGLDTGNGYYTNGTGGNVNLTLYNDANNDIYLENQNTDHVYIGTHSSKQALTVLDGGNVGIGTTTPYKNLEIDASGSSGANGPSISLYEPNGNVGIRRFTLQNNYTVGYNYLTFNVENDTGGLVTSAMAITSAGNVGIGTTSPGSTLAVSGTTNLISSTAAAPLNAQGFQTIITSTANNGGTNITSGTTQSLLIRNLNTTTGNNAQIAFVDGNGHLQGSMGMVYGDHSANFLGDMYIEPRDVATPISLVVKSNGFVGIGLNNPSYTLHVVGTAGLSTGTAWAFASDSRLKDIHGDFEYGLGEILKLHTVRFNYKKDNPLGLPSDRPLTGFIAQEVQKVIPEAVHENANGYLEINVDPIHWAVVNAVQELNSKVEAGHDDDSREISSLKTENATLKSEVDSQKARLDAIERQLTGKPASPAHLHPLIKTAQ